MTTELSAPVPLRIPGLDSAPSLFVHGEEDLHVSRSIRQRGIWEPYETQLLLSLLQPEHVFVDVGANVGYFSVLAASVLSEAGQVFAFEPDPENFRLLQASLAHNGLASRVTAVEAALADRDGEARLFLSEDNLRDHQMHSADSTRRSTPIRLLAGDTGTQIVFEEK